MLEKVHGLSLEDCFNFCFALVNIRDPKAMYHLLRFASAYSQNIPVNIAMGMPKASSVVNVYVKKAEAMATGIADLLGQSLTKANWKPKSRQAGKPKPQRRKMVTRGKITYQII
ncbi:dexh-box atp-dependent rna helicase dexh18 [Quercus suber]|uniref:Dexh-box atp-dependent rna helicase dexh18 n=1 Tax=Quercus suber TaxID=58331 RepID=A0AAW0KI20_QUESU